MSHAGSKRKRGNPQSPPSCRLGAIVMRAQPPPLDPGQVHIWIGASPGDALAHYVDRTEIETGANGKPQLVERSSGIAFNKSDSGELIVVAVARDREVGVDIERIDVGRNIDAVAARFFSRAESLQLDGVDAAERPRRFYVIWTAKEARLKATGRGLSGLASDAPQGLKIVDLDLPDGYVGCVAVESPVANGPTLIYSHRNDW